MPVALGSGGEFDRIRAIAAALGSDIGPIGDDTAASPEGEGTLVVSVDASVEDVHFRRGWLSHEEIGWRATAAALSDLAGRRRGAGGAWSQRIVVPPMSDEKSAAVDMMRGVGAAAASSRVRACSVAISPAGTEWAVVITVLRSRRATDVARRCASRRRCLGNRRDRWRARGTAGMDDRSRTRCRCPSCVRASVAEDRCGAMAGRAWRYGADGPE